MTAPRFTVPAAVNRASAAATNDRRHCRGWIHACEQAREAFGPDHLDTLLAVASRAADRAARNTDDNLAHSLELPTW
jgi:hypothetical protein